MRGIVHLPRFVAAAKANRRQEFRHTDRWRLLHINARKVVNSKWHIESGVDDDYLDSVVSSIVLSQSYFNTETIAIDVVGIDSLPAAVA
jgi:hypothetical protein